MSRPQKMPLQRCFLLGKASRGVEDAAPYKCKFGFFDKLERPRALFFHPRTDEQGRDNSSTSARRRALSAPVAVTVN